jgi:hypothetical protein
VVGVFVKVVEAAPPPPPSVASAGWLDEVEGGVARELRVLGSEELCKWPLLALFVREV